MNTIKQIHELLASRCTEADYEHVQQVARLARSESQRFTALLHDFVEDELGTWDEIETVLGSHGPECLPALRLLTRGSEPYENYVQGIASSGNPLAMSVKAFDLIDHLSPHRWQTLKAEKIDRYVNALRTITVAGQAIAANS